MKILFMCVANSARSQLAEGLARLFLKPETEIASAGSDPTQLNPYAVEVMREIGVDLSSHYSKRVEDLPADFVDELDVVITLCAEEVCPRVVSKAKRLHWPIADPATNEPLSQTEMLQRFRQARDSIRRKITDEFVS